MRRVTTAEEQTAQDLPPVDVQQIVWNESLAMATQVLRLKWKARGLDEDVCWQSSRKSAASSLSPSDAGAPAGA